MTLYPLIGTLAVWLGANSTLASPEAPPPELTPPPESLPQKTIPESSPAPEMTQEAALSSESGEAVLTLPDTALEFSLLTGVYFPRLGGESALGGPTINIDSQFNLDDSESLINFELLMRKGENWEIQFGTLDFSTETTGLFVGSGTFGGLSLTPGAAIRAAVDFSTFNLEVSPGLWRPYRTADTSLRFAPTFGMRWVSVEQTVTLIGTGTRAGEGEWLIPYGGLQLEVQHDPEEWLSWVKMIEIDAGLMTGPAFGGDGGSMWQVRAGLTLHLNDHLGFMFGYRLIELDVEDNAFTFDAGLQGLFLAGSVSF